MSTGIGSDTESSGGVLSLPLGGSLDPRVRILVKKKIIHNTHQHRRDWKNRQGINLFLSLVFWSWLGGNGSLIL